MINFGGERIKFWWGKKGMVFRGGGRMSEILADRRTLPQSPQYGKPCIHMDIFIYLCKYAHIKEFCQQVSIYNEEVPFTSHTPYAQVAILLCDVINLFYIIYKYILYVYIYIYISLYVHIYIYILICI